MERSGVPEIVIAPRYAKHFVMGLTLVRIPLIFCFSVSAILHATVYGRPWLVTLNLAILISAIAWARSPARTSHEIRIARSICCW